MIPPDPACNTQPTMREHHVLSSAKYPFPPKYLSKKNTTEVKMGICAALLSFLMNPCFCRYRTLVSQLRCAENHREIPCIYPCFPQVVDY